MACLLPERGKMLEYKIAMSSWKEVLTVKTSGRTRKSSLWVFLLPHPICPDSSLPNRGLC